MSNRISTWMPFYGSSLKNTQVSSNNREWKMHVPDIHPPVTRILRDTSRYSFTNSGQVSEASDHALDCSGEQCKNADSTSAKR